MLWPMLYACGVAPVRESPADLAPADLPLAALPAGEWPVPPQMARVVKVYDGDTFTLDTGDKVRLMSVNTPELRPLEPFAEAARDLAAAAVLHASVRLNLAGGSPRDAYGRILAEVVGPQGNLAEQLLSAGLAHVFVFPPAPDNLPQLLALETEARRSGLGIWSTPAMQSGLHLTSFHANAPGDDRENVNGEYLRLCNVSGGPLNVGGYQLVDRSGLVHVLPALIVPAAYTVRVHSGPGSLQADPAQSLAIHLGSDIPLWNNTEETVTLLDPRGQPIAERHHHGSAP